MDDSVLSSKGGDLICLLKKQKGQTTVEILLLSAVLVIIAQLVLNQIRKQDQLRPLTSLMNQSLSHMISTGSWNSEKSEAQRQHPNNLQRHYSWGQSE